ncbi:MAG: hydroxymethylglutaryl-CoA reductase, degradative [Gammaproteobacteria bacterium]|nr:hydroxymethylglutaryl-CoA reductase, degradative [Gammaproteobacteria bacterium]MBU2678477.1 hydroxymethylglutaryl-CoA reductase, degradative [Gammaproteobacteria bacterium]NNC57309.1 hydroxymethylglutaryl-CoA reductase, degradative [Woeseiaceae bacterium]NNL52212.1 hydroxymethylglutaryl-CoA reductase, degradative [Woeseiaceae bacterium]
MNDSRIAGLYKLNVAERIDTLAREGWLTSADADRLRDGRQVLSSVAADKIIENVVGVFGLPFAIAPNFRVNDRDYIVPLVVEEPSIVAALSDAARRARGSGGFHASCDESLLAGQVYISGIAHADAAMEALRAAKQEVLDAANEVHPRLSARGGGVRDLEVRLFSLPDGTPLIRVHLWVDTADAMGANLVNTICEAVAPRIATLCQGDVSLRILSNLADRSIVTARVRYLPEDLTGSGFDGAAVRDAIVMASNIATVDPHRAATHNKGIMNGVDALAIATGNDWRAIEAGAHSFAAASGQYRPLTRWTAGTDGALLGEIAIPLKVGTVGGTLDANPAAALGLAVTGAKKATELASLMASVGLAQNFAALRALASSGIQQGHMKLHARSVAAAAGTPDEHFDAVVARLIDSGEIKDWKAEQILDEIRAKGSRQDAPNGTAAGKVILFGEHAAVYGRHALALPIPDAVRVYVEQAERTTSVAIPDWGISGDIDLENLHGVDAAINLILRQLDIPEACFSITVDTRLPRAMGLGSSAAIAVAVTRAICDVMQLPVTDERINAIVFECEKLAHGTPSGVDNTISTYAEPMLFCNDGALQSEALTLTEIPPLVIACSNELGLTSEQVAGVRSRYEQAPRRYEALFDEIDKISRSGAQLLQSRNYKALGLAMNVCHGLLNAIEVSTPELERMVTLARQAGAVGAKLTGGGGGGSIVALCPGTVDDVRTAMQQAGYRTLDMQQ